LACAKILAPTLLEFDDPAIGQKLSQNFGSFTQLPAMAVISAAELTECENIIDSARWPGHDTQAGNAFKAFDIEGAALQVIVTAQQAAIRPYITAVLKSKTTGHILVRLDTPREFSARGIYLFPFAEKSTALVVV
jgi:hypothetical protein